MSIKCIYRGKNQNILCLGSRRPSILPVAENITGSSLNISVPPPEEDGDESEDELEDEVPWRSPSEKIA